jgi:hypothetical protein
MPPSCCQGLLPPRQVPREVEVLRAATALQQAPGPLDKHRLLMALKETNEEVFYALLQVRHDRRGGAEGGCSGRQHQGISSVPGCCLRCR